LAVRCCFRILPKGLPYELVDTAEEKAISKLTTSAIGVGRKETVNFR